MSGPSGSAVRRLAVWAAAQRAARGGASSGGAAAARPAFSSSSAAAPTVFDKLVQLTVVDRVGRRHVVRGVEGQSLVDVLLAHPDTLGGEHDVALSPEGRGRWEAHVKLPNELLAAVPPPAGDDAEALAQLAEPASIDAHSRLGSRVTLSRSMDGTVVALGGVAPWRTL